MCFCCVRAAGSPRCSSSGTWGSRMRSWCWGRCRPQMVTSRLPWSSYLLEAQGSELVPHGQKAFHRGGRGLSCCQGMINDGCRHTIYSFFVFFLTYVPNLHTVRFNWAGMTAFFLWMLLDFNFKINVIMLTSSTPEPLSMLFYSRQLTINVSLQSVFNFAETLMRSYLACSDFILLVYRCVIMRAHLTFLHLASSAQLMHSPRSPTRWQCSSLFPPSCDWLSSQQSCSLVFAFFFFSFLFLPLLNLKSCSWSALCWARAWEMVVFLLCLRAFISHSNSPVLQR